MIMREKGNDLTQSYDKSPTPKSKKQSDNPKNVTKNLGQSGGVATVVHLVWLYRFIGSQPSHNLQKLCYQKDTIQKL